MTQFRILYGAASSAKLGDCKALKEILQQYPEAIHWTISSRQSETLLHLAAENGHPNAVDLLLQHGADPLRQDRRGVIAMAMAIDRGCKKSFELLLPVSITLINDFVAADAAHDTRNCRPLWNAVTGSFIPGITQLIEAGADPHLPLCEGGSSIFAVNMVQPDLPRAKAMLEGICAREAIILSKETPAVERQSRRYTL